MTGEFDWLRTVQTVHIIGAGLNQKKPAHRAFHDASDKGFRMVPVPVSYTHLRAHET